MMTEGVRKAGDQIGDYRLVKAVSEGLLTRTWEAEQISMRRKVMLEMLKVEASKDQAYVDSFLGDVRAKALVKHSGIGAVYEAVADREGTYYARERLDGRSLEECIEAGDSMTPKQVVTYLEQISEAMLHLQSQEMGTVDFAPHHFVIGENQKMRMMNLAIEDDHEEEVCTRGKQLLGALFDEMLKKKEPGATRADSLLGFMADLDREIPLTWKQINTLSKQVHGQLDEQLAAVEIAAISQDVSSSESKGSSLANWGLLGLAAILVGALAYVLRVEKEPQSTTIQFDKVAESRWVDIPPGSHKISGGQALDIDKPFKISRTEITITQYGRFLDALATHNAEEATLYDHLDQPKSKTDHLPTDWETLQSSAAAGASFGGRPTTMDCPVIGIDWWDAWAYSRWEGSRLPTWSEWIVAAHFQGSSLVVSGWGPAGASADDRTGADVVGMAGNVREWTSDMELNPALQTEPKKPVAAGGSFRNPAQGVATRGWIDSRSFKSEDLGFRTIQVK